ncbi:MAG TPA: diguanylate cyclase [Marinagarivorans sp.]
MTCLPVLRPRGQRLLAGLANTSPLRRLLMRLLRGLIFIGGGFTGLALAGLVASLLPLRALTEPQPHLPLAPFVEFKHIDFSDYTNDQTNVGAITAITQDSRGFMWIGGENGLVRYDGHRVTLYRKHQGGGNSIGANYVQDLAPDGDNYLWIATVGGLDRFNLQTGAFDHIEAASGKIPGNDAIAIALYKDLLFLATTEGLGILNRHTLEPVSLPFAEQLPALLHTRYVYVHEDTLWLGTSHLGLIEVDLVHNTVRYYSHDADNPNSIPHSDIRGIFSYDGQTYWLASLGGGVIQFDYLSGQFTQYSPQPNADAYFVTTNVWGVRGDSQGYLWIGTDSAGLWRMNIANGVIEGYVHEPSVFESLNSDKARITFEDNANNLWVGNFSGTVDYYNRERDSLTRYKKSNRFQNGLNHSSVLSLLPAGNGQFWVATEGGLNLMDAEQGSVKSLTTDNSGLLANPVLALERDNQGNIWVGSFGGGLQRYNPKTQQWHNILNHADLSKRVDSAYIWALKNDNQGNLWVGSQKKGVYKLRLADGDVKHYAFNMATSPAFNPAAPQRGIAGEFVRDIELDSLGKLWIASLHGLSRYDEKTDQFHMVLHQSANPNSPASNQAISLLHHSNGELWIGFRDAGLSIYHPKADKFEHIGVQQGLPSPSVNSLLEDADGNVWAGTPVALVKVAQDTHRVKSYKQVHGLVGANHNRNASYLAEDGRVWMGSKEGLTIFHPDLLKQARSSNNVVISGISINHGKTLAKQQWQNERALPKALDYRQNAISFEFSLNEYYLPQLNEYQYRLKGLDQGWQKTMRHNVANYTNLSPGQYTFEVRGKSPDGDWSKQVTRLSFTIEPPPWRQWWAYMLYACFVFAGFAAYRNYMAVRARSAIYQQLSQQDPLTELPNRIALNHRVQMWQSDDLPYGVIVADLDHFKRINDTYGHGAGDLLLKEFSRIAAAETREQDLLGRWGGEEFLIISQTNDMAVLQHIAERIQKVMAMQEFIYQEQVIQITVSFGCATRKPHESFSELFQRADQALYQAKANGRNCVMQAA